MRMEQAVRRADCDFIMPGCAQGAVRPGTLGTQAPYAGRAMRSSGRRGARQCGWIVVVAAE